MDPSADTIFKHKEMLKHRKNCESCPTKVTRKIKFKCQIFLSCLSSLTCLSCLPRVLIILSVLCVSCVLVILSVLFVPCVLVVALLAGHCRVDRSE